MRKARMLLRGDRRAEAMAAGVQSAACSRAEVAGVAGGGWGRDGSVRLRGEARDRP